MQARLWDAWQDMHTNDTRYVYEDNRTEDDDL
jgi:hypothetical protein